MVEWNTIFRLFRFSGILSQPREVLPKFRNEIPENVYSIRSPTRNFRNFWSNGKRPKFPTPRAQKIVGAIHSTKISGNFGPKLNGTVQSNRKSFKKTSPPFEVDHFSRSDRLEFWLNGLHPVTSVRGFHQRIIIIYGYQVTLHIHCIY